MTEKIPVPTIRQMLQGIDDDVLRTVREQLESDPEKYDEAVVAAYASDLLPDEVKSQLKRYAHSEEHKNPPRKSREEIGVYAGTVALATVWQAENKRARKRHKTAPHKPSIRTLTDTI